MLELLNTRKQILFNQKINKMIDLTKKTTELTQNIKKR